MPFKLDIDTQNENQTDQRTEAISREDRTVWFIWIGLVLVAIGSLPFIARSPGLVQYIADICLSVKPF